MYSLEGSYFIYDCLNASFMVALKTSINILSTVNKILQ